MTNAQPIEVGTDGGDDVSRVMNALRSVIRSVRLNTRWIEQRIGISLAQLFVLQQLAERSATSLNELAERTATHQSSVSVVVKRLVDAGYVERTPAPDDRRRVLIQLTEAGRAKLGNAPPTVQVRLITSLQGLPDAERKALADLMELWLTTAGVDLAAPPMMGEE